MISRDEAKNKLDNLIKKSRVHLYKPIQIAEILYHDRIYKNIDLSDVESYRAASKHWRDDITFPLLGRVCTSSSKFQDNLFEPNAMPPQVIEVLGKENRKTKGAVEAYIYGLFLKKHLQLAEALDYCLNATKENFDVKQFMDSFWNEPGLRRSIDKIYEIVVYSLFSTLVTSLEIKVEVSVSEDKIEMLEEFLDFAKMVMCIDKDKKSNVQDAGIYRVGVTNAADRGLDMFANWGAAIQVKHLSLDENLAEEIVNSVSCDKIIVVCKDAEKNIIRSLLNQIGWQSHIQDIITEQDLIEWYEKALRGKYSDELGAKLIACMCEEIAEEFPAVCDIPNELKDRHYEQIENDFWI